MIRDPGHFLKPLVRTQTPNRLAWFDCQSRQNKRNGVIERDWLCGALGFTHWTSKKNVRVDRMFSYVDPLPMWEELDRYCVKGKRVVIWTFGLPEQIRTSQALIHLPAMGWHLQRIVLEQAAAWALLRNEDRSLMFCDLHSWAPVEWVKVQDVTEATTDHETAQPKYDSQRETVAINRARRIRQAVIDIMGWIDGEQLGTFKPTGSGQSYSAYRRRFMADRLYVHDDVPRLQAERLSMWTGRTEAWRHGRLRGGPFLELDMKAAYCRIAAQCEVPTVARSEMPKPNLTKCLHASRSGAVLAHIQVKTDVPCLPASMGNYTAWPVGEFDTWAWSPELELAAQHCKEVKVTKAYKYRTAPALQGFAEYVLEYVDNKDASKGAIPLMVMKHWSRSLVGRFALRYRSWVHYGYNEDPDLSMVTFIDAEEGEMTDMLIVGTDRLLLAGLEESTESLPQIPGWIMSECRRRLFMTMQAVGFDNVVYVDTDSIIIDTHGDARLERDLIERYRGLWAPKAKWDRLTIYGPRNIRLDDDRRISGLPGSAFQSGPLEFRGQVMRSIKESMRHGQLDRVVSVPRTFMFTAPDIRRGHNPDGSTFPFILGQSTIN